MSSDGYYTEEVHGPHEYLDLGTCWGHLTMFNLREQDTAAIDAIYAGVLAG